MLLAEAGCVFVGLILCISGPVKGSCSKGTSTKGHMCSKNVPCTNNTRALKLKFTPEIVHEGQKVKLICSDKCLPANTTYSWYWNNVFLKQQNQGSMALEAVTYQQEGMYNCVAAFGNNSIHSEKKYLRVISLSNIQTSAAAIGAFASVLVTIPAIVFIWIRTKRTSGQSSTTERTGNTMQLDHGPVYENIPARATEQDDPYYSTIHFSSTVQPCQPTEHEPVAYTVVNFRPHI